MRKTPPKNCLLAKLLFCGLCLTGPVHALELATHVGAPTADISGVLQLRAFDPTLLGSGVAMAMADSFVDPEVSGQSASKMYYVTSGSVFQTAPPYFGAHAGSVSRYAIGTGGGGNIGADQNGMAPDIGAFYSLETGNFVSYNIFGDKPLPGGIRIVNQSFGYDGWPTNYDRIWDNFAAKYNTLFVSSAGNGPPVVTSLPAAAYNGLAVGASATTSHGFTPDGRVYPYISYPGGTTSGAAGAVSGAAAVLMQAAAREDGGAGTAVAATDSRTLKALLMNGATRDANWSNSATVPLDTEFGAGIMNIFNAYTQLKGGKLAPGEMTSLAGWDLRSLSSQGADASNSYRFSLESDALFPSITLASTIVWNRQYGQADINHLTLELYNADTGLLVPGGASLSAVDNVQMLYLPTIGAGNYELRVKKLFSQGQVSAEETYAMAFSAAGSYVFTGDADRTWSSQITGSLPVIKKGDGVLTLTGSNSHSGGTMISSGTVRVGNANALGQSLVTLGGGLDLAGYSASAEALSGTGAVTSSGTGLLVLTLRPVKGPSTPSYGGQLSDGAAKIGVTISGTGTQIFTGANTYSGKTSISEGALSVASLNRISGGSASSNLGAPVTVAEATIDLGSTTKSGTLVYTGTGETTDRVINLAGTTGGGVLDQSGARGLLKFTSDLAVTGSGAKTLTLQGATDGIGEFAGAIVDGVSATGVTKWGTGTWILSASNSYTGATTINAGVLRLDHADALSGGLGVTGGKSALVFKGGVLGLATGDFTRSLASGTNPAGVSFAAGNGGWAAYGADRVVNLGGNGATVVWSNVNTGLASRMLILSASSATHTLDFKNALDLGTSTRTVQVDNGAAAVDARMSGNIIGGTTGGLSKTGDGLLALSGSNNFSGRVTIGGGILRLEHSSALPGATALTFNGGVLELGAGDFTRSLAAAGTPGTVNFTGSGGWSAYGADRVVNLGGNGATVAWGAANTGFNGQDLVLSSSSATHTVDLQNAIDLGSGVNRFLDVHNGAALVDAKISGNISGAGALYKREQGTLMLSGSNSYSGNTFVTGGALHLAKQSSLYGGVQANWTPSKINVDSGASLVLGVGDASGGYFDAAAIGTMLDASHMGLSSSTSGLKSGANLGFDTTNASSGVFSYDQGITNVAGLPMGFIKSGDGTLILAGSSTYSGTTYVMGGTLQLGSGTSTGSIASNRVILSRDGNLTYSNTSATSFTISTSVTGTGSLNVNSGANTYLNNGALYNTTGAQVWTFTKASGSNSGLNLASSGSATLRSGSSIRMTGFVGSATVFGGSLTYDTSAGNGDIFLQTTSGQAGINNNLTNQIINAGAGNVTLSDFSGAFNGATVATTITAGVLNSSATYSLGTLDVTLSSTNTASTWSGLITGAANLTKRGAGTLVLSNANSFSGTTTIHSGTLLTAHALALQNSVLDTSTGNGTLEFSGTTLSLGGLSGNRALASRTGSAFGTATTLTLNPQTGVNTTYSGEITEGVSGLKLVKSGAGIQTLSGSNRYSGETLVSAGVLRLDGPNALPGGIGASGGTSALRFQGGILGLGHGDFTRSLAAAGVVTGVNFSGTGGWAAYGADRAVNLGGNDTPSTISWAAPDTGLNGQTLVLGAASATHTLDFQNSIDLGNAVRTIQVDDGLAVVDGKFSGTLSGAGGLIKTGSGVLALTGSNSYTGQTTISAGVLRLDAADALSGGIGATGGLSGLTFTGGVLGLGAGDFTRSLAAAGVGSGVNFTNAGGWAAYGADRNVNLGGNATPSTIFWATAGTGLNGQILILGATSATHTVNLLNSINLGASSRSLWVNDGAARIDGRVSGSITGGAAAAGLTKLGTGALALSGSNSYTGVTTISAGVLVLENDAALPGGTGASGGISGLTFSGGILGLASGDFHRSLAAAGTPNGVTFTSSGGWAAYGADRVVNLGANSSTVSWATAGTGFNGRTLLLSDSTATHTVDLQNPIDLGNAVRTVTANNGAAAVDGKLSGALSGVGGGLTKNGLGLLALTGSNSYTGVTTVSSGVLRLDSAEALPGGIGASGGVSGLTFSGGVLGLAHGDFTRSLAAAGTGTGVTFSGNGGWAAYGANRRVNLGGNSAGIVWATANTGLGGRTLILSDETATHSLDFQNPIDLGTTARTVQVNDGAASVDGKMSGALSGTGGGLTKSGAGTLELSAANSYSGATTVSAGQLMVSGTLANTSAVTVARGAELKVTGKINAASTTTVNGVLSGDGSLGAVLLSGSDASLAPGGSGIASMNVRNLSIGDGGTLSIQVGKNSSGDNAPFADMVLSQGQVSLGSDANLELSLSMGSYSPILGDIIFVIANSGTESFSGSFGSLNGVATDLSQGSVFSWESQLYQVSYTADFFGGGFEGFGNDMALLVVPEPGTWTLLLLILGFWSCRRRCRRA